MSSFFKLIRINHWVKNTFLFVATFFGGVISLEIGIDLVVGFISFSLLASSIYIINDLNDVEEDQLHPTKKYRPIAAGIYSKKTARLIAVTLVLFSFGISLTYLSPNFSFLTLCYLVLNLAYSYYLKQISILEMLIVSSGFLIRVIAGAEIASVTLSLWLLLMTFLFSLFIVVAKRRDDFMQKNNSAVQLRKVNKHYSLQFLNTLIITIGTLLMVCYLMYTFSSEYFTGKTYFALTSCVLVVMGIIRYFQAIFVENKGGSPTAFALKDRFIQLTLFCWIAIFCYLIYL